jgi:peptidoglycan/xylan/chitin deacetylase (PgdA/CDA1 family)
MDLSILLTEEQMPWSPASRLKSLASTHMWTPAWKRARAQKNVVRELGHVLRTGVAAQQLAVSTFHLAMALAPLTLADCGSNSSYCYSPNCQYKYGPGCPEHQKPKGKSTESIPRAKIGSVPYGGNGVYHCKNPGDVAITYDDGPHKDFTATILDLFKKYDAKATFFITGNNIAKGQIDETQEYIDVIKRMDAEGHQIASHTWTHLDLSKIDKDDRKNQILNVEGALNNIVGKIPTYIRPPYSSCTVPSGCEQDMQDLGYHVIYFDVDTDDYEQNPKNTFQNSLDWFKGNMTKENMSPQKNSSLSISHDIIDKTANELTEFMLKTITELGYKGVTVGECLGDPKDNWYRQFGDPADRVGANSTSTSASSSSTSSQVLCSATCFIDSTNVA